MKSAYEIAMERLAKESGPVRSLTDAQRARIADINATYDAKAAEVRLQYDTKLNAIATADEAHLLQAQLADELASLESRREREKEAVWNEASSS